MRAFIAAFVLLFSGSLAMAAEQPEYEVLSQTSDYEIRRYPALLAATLDVEGAFDDIGSKGFRVLADYIFGNNRKAGITTQQADNADMPSQKIAMTAPVNMQPHASGANRYRYRFFMPREWSLETIPLPNDARVHLEEVSARIIAARRYSGNWDQDRYREQERALLDALQRDGKKPAGEPIFAKYNAPFVPTFLRRNEVWVELAE
jgi:hypothetical protein